MSVEEFKQFETAEQHSRSRFFSLLWRTAAWVGKRTFTGNREQNPPPVSPNSPSSRGRGRWLWQILTILVLVVALGGGGLLFHLDQRFAGQIYPNISISGVQVGQLTETNASDILHERHAAFLQQPVTLTYGDSTWTPSLAELGVQLEIAAAVQDAFGAGRNHGLINNLFQVAAVWEHGLDLPLRLTIDQATMQQYLLARATEVEEKAVAARITLRGTEVRTTPAVAGRQVLINETMQETIAALQTLSPQMIVLRTREIPPSVDNAAVATAEQAIAALLQGPLTLRANDREWVWSEEDLAKMVEVTRTPRADGAGVELNVTLKPEKLRQQLAELARDAGSEATNPRVDWNGGDLKIIEAGQRGRQINIARAEQLILAAVTTPDRTINLPFHMAEPSITAATLDQISIPDLIAVGQSDFSGSAAYRITNIKAGMDLLHGILVAPGEEFSFNKNIEITAANGFVEGYAIVDNRTQLEWGGGICQDSTTMFRAAFWAGLPITERHGHSFYISWYDQYGYGKFGNGPGMDATIYTGPGGSDLKFVNDTGNWLLLQTYVDTDQALAEVRIYGTKTNRTVELEGPPYYQIVDWTAPPSAPVYVADPNQPRGVTSQTDTARGGMTINFTRIIKENGVEVNRETFVTTFKPWPNIFVVNPANMPGWRPAAAAAPPEAPPSAEATPPAEAAPATEGPPAVNPEVPAETQPTQPEVPVTQEPAPAPLPDKPLAPPGDIAPIPLVPPGDIAPIVPPDNGGG